MRPLFGPRTVVEAAFIVAVPVIALETGFKIWGIVIAGTVAYLLVVLVELGYWYEGKRKPLPPAAQAPAPAVPEAEPHVRVIRADPDPEPEPQPVREPPPVPVAVVAAPEPEPEPEPEPVPEPPRLAPALPPLPEPELELPPAAAVTRIGGPRQWNVWDLERVAREGSGGDPIADEERTFLLMYLRDFAGADGLLPVDFDDLVRQSFGGLVANL